MTFFSFYYDDFSEQRCVSCCQDNTGLIKLVGNVLFLKILLKMGIISCLNIWEYSSDKSDNLSGPKVFLVYISSSCNVPY